MNASDLREKTEAELQEELMRLLKDQFNYRMSKATGQLGQSHLKFHLYLYKIQFL